ACSRKIRASPNCSPGAVPRSATSTVAQGGRSGKSGETRNGQTSLPERPARRRRTRCRPPVTERFVRDVTGRAYGGFRATFRISADCLRAFTRLLSKLPPLRSKANSQTATNAHVDRQSAVRHPGKGCNHETRQIRSVV